MLPPGQPGALPPRPHPSPGVLLAVGILACASDPVVGLDAGRPRPTVDGAVSDGAVSDGAVDAGVGAGASVCPDRPGMLTDCAAVSGVDVGPVVEPRLPTLAVNAAAVADADGDGLPEALVYNLAAPVRLYRNRGGFRFEDVTTASGLGELRATGAAFGDLDNDGDPDLVVTLGLADYLRGARDGPTQQAIQVFRNDGALRFTDVSTAWGFGTLQGTVTRAVVLGVDLADVNLDGVLDVLPRRHLDPTAQSWAYLSAPGGTWTESGEATLGTVTGSAFAGLWADVDGDGLPEAWMLYDAGDGAPARALGRTSPAWPPRYVQQPVVPALFGDGALGRDLMGSDTADVDGDGRLEVYVTDIGPQHLLHQGTTGGWTDVAGSTGAAAGVPPDGGRTVAYAVRLVDWDNDTWPDVALACSTDHGNHDPPYAFLLHNRGDGSFTDDSARLHQTRQYSEQGLVASDLDRDGTVDLWFGGAGEPPRMFRNQAATGRSVAVRLRGRVSTAEGVGARVTVTAGARRMVSVMYAGGNPYGYNEHRLVFGLGAAPRADGVEVRWPDGYIQSAGEVPAGTEALVTEPAWLSVTPPVATLGDTVTVTVRPAAADGSPRGPGHAVTVTVEPDGTTLPVTDTGDGRYVSAYHPPAAGLRAVAVTVDGVAFAARPEVLTRSPGGM